MNNSFSLTGELIDLNPRISRNGTNYLVLHIQPYQAEAETRSWVQAPFELLAYGDVADLAQKELAKGTLAVFEGRITSSERNVQSYNEPGQTVTYYSTGLTVSDYCILGSAASPKAKSASPSNAGKSGNQAKPIEPAKPVNTFNSAGQTQGQRAQSQQPSFQGTPTYNGQQAPAQGQAAGQQMSGQNPVQTGLQASNAGLASQGAEQAQSDPANPFENSKPFNVSKEELKAKIESGIAQGDQKSAGENEVAGNNVASDAPKDSLDFSDFGDVDDDLEKPANGASAATEESNNAEQEEQGDQSDDADFASAFGSDDDNGDDESGEGDEWADLFS